MQEQTHKKKLTPEQRERKLLMARLYKQRHKEEIREYNKKYKSENATVLSEKRKEYLAERPGLSSQWSREWARRNPTAGNERKLRWALANPEKRAAASKRYRESNWDAHRDAQRLWRKNNPERARANVNARRRRLREAMPPWVDRKAIRAIYREAIRTGMTVDHIIPLENPLVCGLHVPCNLRLLPWAENLSKGNRFQIVHTTDAGTDA